MSRILFSHRLAMPEMATLRSNHPGSHNDKHLRIGIFLHSEVALFADAPKLDIVSEVVLG